LAFCLADIGYDGIRIGVVIDLDLFATCEHRAADIDEVAAVLRLSYELEPHLRLFSIETVMSLRTAKRLTAAIAATNERATKITPRRP
jgi:hypothetical protein